MMLKDQVKKYREGFSQKEEISIGKSSNMSRQKTHLAYYGLSQTF